MVQHQCEKENKKNPVSVSCFGHELQKPRPSCKVTQRYSAESEHSSETYKHSFFRTGDELTGILIAGTPLFMLYQAISILTGKPGFLYVCYW
jgi:hypothetical protein